MNTIYVGYYSEGSFEMWELKTEATIGELRHARSEDKVLLLELLGIDDGVDDDSLIFMDKLETDENPNILDQFKIERTKKRLRDDV